MPWTHIGNLVGYGGSNVYHIWVPQNGEVLTARDVEFQEDEMFDPKDEPMRENRLRVYRKDPDGVAPLLDIHQPQDQDTDSEIWSVIVVGDEDNPDGNRIESEDDRLLTTRTSLEIIQHHNPWKNRLTRRVHQNQAQQQLHQNLPPILNLPFKSAPSEISSSRAETPSSSSSEPPQPSQRRTRSGRVYRVIRGSNFAIQPVLSSFHAGSIHRLHRRDLPQTPRGWKDLQKHSNRREFLQACDQEWRPLTNMKILEI